MMTSVCDSHSEQREQNQRELRVQPIIAAPFRKLQFNAYPSRHNHLPLDSKRFRRREIFAFASAPNDTTIVTLVWLAARENALEDVRLLVTGVEVGHKLATTDDRRGPHLQSHLLWICSNNQKRRQERLLSTDTSTDSKKRD